MKVVNRSDNFFSIDSEGTKRYMTDWICDSADDITTANTSGSDYLKFPSGSSILCLANSKLYVLNEAQTEYVEVG